jgi:hypothetical protein
LETPAVAAKKAGIKSLKEVSTITGVSSQTLSNWHKHKNDLFKIVLLGCSLELAINNKPKNQ